VTLDELGFTEELDLLLMFDIAVQNGGMGSKGRLGAARARLNHGMSALERGRAIAQVVVDSIAGQFKNNVLRRKMCIANGSGSVHGESYELAGWRLRMASRRNRPSLAILKMARPYWSTRTTIED
jgi:hypothetical protein